MIKRIPARPASQSEYRTEPEAKTWFFDSTGDAYDACQCREDIKDGDVLVIESEQVIGVAHCWPLAVTVTQGHLHRPKDGMSIHDLSDYDIGNAVEAAKRRGWAVRS